MVVQLARSWGAEVLTDPASGEEVDLVVDTAGGEAFRAATARLRPGGRLVSIAEEITETADDLDAAVFFIVEPDRDQLLGLAELVDRGELRPAVDSVFPLADAAAAFARTEERGKRGKVVLQVAAGDGAQAR